MGDRIRLLGHTTDLDQSVDSIQIEHESVEAAKAGDRIGVKVNHRCRRGDCVYRLSGEHESARGCQLDLRSHRRREIQGMPAGIVIGRQVATAAFR